MAVDAGGNVVVTGISNRDGYTAKYAAIDGSLLWGSPFNSSELSVGVAVALDKLGNVFVTGYSGTNGSYYNYFTAKYAAANDAMLWGRRYTEAYGEANDVAIDREGNAVVTGKAAGFNGEYDYLTIKYGAADGSILWEKRYAGPANSSDTARAVAVDADDNVVVTGSSYNGIRESATNCSSIRRNRKHLARAEHASINACPARFDNPIFYRRPQG